MVTSGYTDRVMTEKYIAEMVLPTILDFEHNPTSRRHAFLAAVTVYHTLDYMFRSKPVRCNKRKDFCATSDSFKLIDHVAHAFKHVESVKRDGSLNSDDVIARPPAYWGTAVWDLSRWDDSTGGVTTRVDVNADLLGALRDAVIFLRAQLG